MSLSQRIDEQPDEQIDERIDDRIDDLEELIFRLGFRRSKKGNLWRTWDGYTLTVFSSRRCSDSPRYGYCISDEDGPRFGSRYATEEEALEALWCVVGEW